MGKDCRKCAYIRKDGDDYYCVVNPIQTMIVGGTGDDDEDADVYYEIVHQYPVLSHVDHGYYCQHWLFSDAYYPGT